MSKIFITALCLVVSAGVFAQEGSDWDYFAYIGKSVDAVLEAKIEPPRRNEYRIKKEFLKYFDTVHFVVVEGRIVLIGGSKEREKALQLFNTFDTLPYVRRQTREGYDATSYTGINGNNIGYSVEMYQYALKESGFYVYVAEHIDSRPLPPFMIKREEAIIYVYDPKIIKGFYAKEGTLVSYGYTTFN